MYVLNVYSVSKYWGKVVIEVNKNANPHELTLSQHLLTGL